jgi:hypothetical protein
MIEIFHNVFVGSEQDYYLICHQSNWAILHCCKNPFHCTFVGYRGSLPPSHPDYALKRKENEMALNLVDMDRFSSVYLDFNRNMFSTAFAFLDEYRVKGCKLLIHCNQGESRAPTLGMLYAARLGAFDYADFDTSVQKLRAIYPGYNPKNNIYLTVKSLWRDFVPNP